MADRVIYGAGSEDEETEAERRRRGAHTPSDGFEEDRFGDVTEPNPDDPRDYRDAGGRDYGYEGSAAYGYGGGYGAEGEYVPNDFDAATEDMWLVGDLTGGRGRRARAEAERERHRREAALADLAEFMPNANDLMVDYRHEGRVDAGADSLAARDAFARWSEGGLTDTDRATMEESRRAEGRAARADREATMSAMAARGMGGSGAELAGALAAGEGAADRGAAMDASMMGAAQQRQYNATRALGEFGAREDDYSRGLEGRNTTYDHSTAESRSDARQQAHENRERHTGMSIGLDPFGQASPSEARDDEDDAWERTIGAVTSIFD
jgi:hypothetical protein